MKAKKNLAFIITITSVYVLTVLIYGVSLFMEYKNGLEKSRSRFNSITKDVSRISRTYTPRSDKFYDELLISLGNVSDIAGIQLVYGNELIFSYPKDLKELNNINEHLVQPLTTTVFTSNGIPMNLTASVYTLKPSSIFYKGRIAFIVVLAATVFTAIYLIVCVKKGTFPTEAESDDLDEDEIDYPDVSYYDIEAEKDDSEAQEEHLAEEPSEEAAEEKKEEIVEEKEDDVLSFLNEEKVPEENDSKTETLNAADEAVEKNDGNESENSDSSQPKGLFCPDTGFGWEEYMITRLDSELLRSASSDQDISLFTIKIEGIDWKSDCGKKISKLILEIVKFNDLVFNHGTDEVSAIFQNQNTDQALVTAESVHNKLVKLLSENNQNNKVAIGISTRSLRLISASRLANESEEALKRAIADPDSPIIAFRVNPERYKDFLASESFQEKDRPLEKSEDEKLLESLPEPPADDDEDGIEVETEVSGSESFDDFDIDEELKT